MLSEGTVLRGESPGCNPSLPATTAHPTPGARTSTNPCPAKKSSNLKATHLGGTCQGPLLRRILCLPRKTFGFRAFGNLSIEHNGMNDADTLFALTVSSRLVGLGGSTGIGRNRPTQIVSWFGLGFARCRSRSQENDA